MVVLESLTVLPPDLAAAWKILYLDHAGWALLADMLEQRGDPEAEKMRRILAAGDRRGGTDAEWFRYVERFFRLAQHRPTNR